MCYNTLDGEFAVGHCGHVICSECADGNFAATKCPVCRTDEPLVISSRGDAGFLDVQPVDAIRGKCDPEIRPMPDPECVKGIFDGAISRRRRR